MKSGKACSRSISAGICFCLFFSAIGYSQSASRPGDGARRATTDPAAAYLQSHGGYSFELHKAEFARFMTELPGRCHLRIGFEEVDVQPSDIIRLGDAAAKL
jgi:hypothetical protein